MKATARPSLAFYGDSIGAEVYVIDVDNMALAARIPTGAGPYPVDHVAPDTLFAITRGEASVTPIDLTSLTAKPSIALPHKPRSSSAARDNPNGLVLVSGADKPMTSVIDIATGDVRPPVGRDTTDKPRGFGGLLASGHERWADKDRLQFFVLDRVFRRIEIYSAEDGGHVWGVDTPGPVHHLQPDTARPTRWFATCEGDPAALLPPAVMAIETDGVGGFAVTDLLFLPVERTDRPRMGSHHVDLSPDGRFLYIGSNEGKTYVLEHDPLRLVTAISTGLGSGHTGFLQVSGRQLAITINHTDQHVTVIDVDRQQQIADVKVTDAIPTGSQRTQGRTSGVRDKFFYMMASLDADFVEIDLEQMVVLRALALPTDAPPHGGRPLPMQGTFVWQRADARTLTDCC